MRADLRAGAERPTPLITFVAAVAGFALAAGVGTEQLEAIRLATSEAVTNAVLHAYELGCGSFQVTASFMPGELWLMVNDFGPFSFCPPQELIERQPVNPGRVEQFYSRSYFRFLGLKPVPLTVRHSEFKLWHMVDPK